MPRIPDEIIESVTFLYKSVEAADKGEEAGGSGFVVSVPSESTQPFLYAVTNHHVVTQGGTVVRMSNRLGEKRICAQGTDDWHERPDADDVAIAPLGLSSEYPGFSAAVPRDGFITKDALSRVDIGPGTETFSLGRFLDLEGRQHK